MQSDRQLSRMLPRVAVLAKNLPHLDVTVQSVTIADKIALALVIARDVHTHRIRRINQAPLYRLVDLGTFGGPLSLVFTLTGNSNQQHTLVTSCADTTELDLDWPNVNPFFGDDPYIQHAFSTRSGHLKDLGVLPGGTSSCGQAINANGVVAGFSTNGDLDPLTGFPQIEAVRWRNGKILDLGTLGGNGGVAWSLNDSGQITGGALNSVPDSFAGEFFPGATQVHAFLWQKGAMEDLGTLGGADSMAFYINQRGDITGQSFINDIPNETTGIPTVHPFFWSNGRMQDLGTLGGRSGSPNALNNRGQVAGTSKLAGDQSFHPFLWDRGTLRDLGTFGGSNGEASWLNDEGAVVGYATFPGDTRWDAFLWRRGVMTDLGNLGCASKAVGINSGNQVVGASRLADCATRHAFLWENGKIYDLNDLIPADSGLELVETQAINDAGVITGNGLPAGCDDLEVCGHAYILFPCARADEGECGNERTTTLGSAALSPVLIPPSSNIDQKLRVDELRESQNPLTQRGRFGRRRAGGED